MDLAQFLLDSNVRKRTVSALTELKMERYSKHPPLGNRTVPKAFKNYISLIREVLK